MRRLVKVVFPVAFTIIVTAGTAIPAGFDGTWQANGVTTGRAGQGCSPSWYLRLTVAQGQASGAVVVGAGTQPLQNLVVGPDGTFTATAAQTVSPLGRTIQGGPVSGKLSGETITVTYTSSACGPRDATGARVSG